VGERVVASGERVVAGGEGSGWGWVGRFCIAFSFTAIQEHSS